MFKSLLVSCLLLTIFFTHPAYCVYPYKKDKPPIPKVFKDRKEAKAWVLKLRDAAQKASDVDHLNCLKTEHPRLIISKDDISRLKKLVVSDQDAKLLLENLKRKGEKYIEEPEFKFTAAGDGNYLESGRHALKRISILAGLFLITDDRRYLDRARKKMSLIATYKSWNPEHFLDVAEMTCAMAIGYDWLYEELSEKERIAIRKAIIESGIKPGLKQYEIHKWWTYSPFNWNLVCNGGLVVGALAVADKEPELANRVINCARLSVPYAMATFNPDGGWPEGPSYWCYCTRYAMFLFSSLESALDNDFGWLKNPGFSKTGFFRIHVTSPTGMYFNYADSNWKERKAAQMFWFAKKFNQPVFAYSEMDTAKNLTDIFHLLFYPDNTETFREKGLDTAALFKSIDVGFYRSSWSDKDALYLGFKGGNNSVGHAHLDLGTFVLDWFGKRWAMELGSDNYSLPGYFDGERWSYLRLKTEGQNCFVLDGKNQDSEARAPITRFETDNGFNTSIDLSEAYKDYVDKATRAFKLRGKSSITVSDKIMLKKPVSISWNMYTRARVEVAGDGRKAVLSYPDTQRKIVLHIDEPSAAKLTVTEIQLEKPQRTTDGIRRINLTFSNNRKEVSIVLKFEANGNGTEAVHSTKSGAFY